METYFLLRRKTVLRKVLLRAVLIQKSHWNQDQFIFWGAFAFVEHQIFLGQQSIQCTGMNSGPMSPINEKKAPHPTPGQAKVRLSRGIYITAKGFAELKDHRTGKECKADLEWDCQPLASLGTPGLYSHLISAFVQFGPGSPGWWWARCKRGELPTAGGKRRKSGRIECGDPKYVTEQGVVLQRALRQASAVWPSTFMPHLPKCRAPAATVLEETLCKLETMVKSLSMSSVKSGPSENAHPVLEAPVLALVQTPAPS